MNIPRITSGIRFLTRVQRLINHWLVCALLLVGIFLALDGRVFVQNATQESQSAVARAGHVERVISEPFDAIDHFIKCDPKHPEKACLVQLTAALITAIKQLGAAAADFSGTSKAATGTLNELKTTVTNVNQFLPAATTTVQNVGDAFKSLKDRLESDDFKGSVHDVRLLLDDAHAVGTELSAFMDPKAGMPMRLYKSMDDSNAMTADMRVWIHRNTKKPRVITTVVGKVLDLTWKGLTAAKGY